MHHCSAMHSHNPRYFTLACFGTTPEISLCHALAQRQVSYSATTWHNPAVQHRVVLRGSPASHCRFGCKQSRQSWRWSPCNGSAAARQGNGTETALCHCLNCLPAVACIELQCTCMNKVSPCTAFMECCATASCSCWSGCQGVRVPQTLTSQLLQQG